MKPMTFDRWCKERDVKMRAWQKRAATFLLREMHPYQAGTSGKSFLMKHLNEFLLEHGNDYHVSNPQAHAGSLKYYIDKLNPWKRKKKRVKSKRSQKKVA